jgi:hypothetical protein
MIHEPPNRSNANLWLQTTANTIALLMIVGSTFLLIADMMTKRRYDDQLFAIADNLFVVSAILSCIMVLVFARSDKSIDIVWPRQRRLITSFIIGAISVLVELAVTSFYYDSMGLYQLIFSIIIGINTGIIVFNMTTSRSLAGHQPLVSEVISLPTQYKDASPEAIPAELSISLSRIYKIYGVLLLLIVAAIVLRVVAPGTTILVWFEAPLNMFLVPGLSLAIAVLPSSARWLEWFLFAPALAIGTQLTGLVWLDLIGIPAKVPVFFLLTTLITLAGFLGSIYRYRAFIV